MRKVILGSIKYHEKNMKLLWLLGTPRLPLYQPPLTPKIPCAILTKSADFDIVGKVDFSKNRSKRI
jgi:hypothetical protein